MLKNAKNAKKWPNNLQQTERRRAEEVNRIIPEMIQNSLRHFIDHWITAML